MRLSTSLFTALPMAALAASGAFATGTTIHSADGDFICASQDEAAPLAKTADLPKVTKVYAGKSVAIMVKIAFSGTPYTTTDSTINKAHAAINTLYLAMSRNTFQFDFKIHPEVWIAPGTAADYGANFNSLQSFISTKLKESGYTKLSTSNPNGNYTVFVAHFPRIGVSWAGLSNGPGGGGNYINGSYSTGVTAHELGHAVGLPHAHSIEAGTDIFGTPGTTTQHVEYGNPYDVMGSAGGMGHFNVNFKWRTGWMDANEALEVKNTGVYRIYAHDNPIHKGRLLGIRVPSTDTRYAYWFEYRTVHTTARNGAVAMFEGFQGTNSRGIHILDLTPGSRTSGDASDAVLVPGKDFKDKYGTATFKTLAINSGVWTENGWVDVEVTIPGSQPVNIAPLRSPVAALLHPGAVRAFDLSGRALGAALPAKTLVLKHGGGLRLADGASVLMAKSAR